MPDNARWIFGVAIAVGLLGLIVFVRLHVQAPPPEPEAVAPARIPTHSAKPIVRHRAGIDAGEPSYDDGSEAVRGVGSSVHPNQAPGIVVKQAADPQDSDGDNEGGTPGPGEGHTASDGRAVLPKKIVAKGTASLSVNFDGGSANTPDQLPPIVMEGLEFDPRFGAARFGPGAALAYPDSGGINLEEGSISLWVLTEWDPRDPTVAIEGKTLAELKIGTWENRIEIHMGPRYLTFQMTTSDGIEHGTGSAIQWAKGEWHHVATTWGQALMSLYIDTELASQTAYDGTMEIPPETPLYICSTKAPLANQGTVSCANFKVFQNALAQEDIAAIASQTVPPAVTPPSR